MINEFDFAAGGARFRRWAGAAVEIAWWTSAVLPPPTGYPPGDTINGSREAGPTNAARNPVNHVTGRCQVITSGDNHEGSIENVIFRPRRED